MGGESPTLVRMKELNYDGRIFRSVENAENGEVGADTRFSYTPEILPDGRIRLHERWQWTNGDGSSGTSIVEELPST